jgi:hypothetical protein
MKPTLFFFILISIVACDMVVDVDVPFEKKQLVVNSSFNPDSLWSANVSLNKHILDESSHESVTNASVLIYENDIAVDQLIHRGNGLYTSNNGKPEVGKTYRIEISAGAYDPIAASSHIPNAAPIKSMETTMTENQGGASKIIIRFQDNGNESNYYQIKAYNRSFSLREDFAILEYKYSIELSIDDPSGEAIAGDDWSDGIFLNDILFNGKEKEVTLKTHYPPQALTVELRTISVDLYNYETTSALQNSINGDPLAQPVNVYSNVKKGFGIFAGYSAETRKNDEGYGDLKIISASDTQVKPYDLVELTVENLRPSGVNDYFTVVMKSESDYAYSYTYVDATRTSANTLQFYVSAYALSGKLAVIQNGNIAVSDFEILVE